ncbi:leucine-rich repeat protein [Alloiococcus sp. CFN-8]|uniref:leucine-rich repeat protein n=1 Tax=Alloiococcus sp. CFN-8 TaxID=3416081 RepID=UPI003CF84DB9
MRRYKGFICLFLSAIMVVSTVPIEVLALGAWFSRVNQAIELEATEEELVEEKRIELLKENSDPMLLEDYDIPALTDVVEVIVTVKGDSLVQRRNNLGLDSMTISDFAVSDTGKSEIADITESQEEVKEEIQDLGIEVDTKYSYTTLLNGFSMSVEYGKVPEISQLENVESVVLSILYEKEDNVDGEEVMGGVVNSLATSGYANTSDFQGEGTVIGILDTGLDYNHEAFVNGVEDAELTKNDLKKMLHTITPDNMISLYSYASYWYAQENFDGSLDSLLELDDLYVSEKVPFAFDYADVDPDVNPSPSSVTNYGNDHGTHVAGIAAGKTIASNGDVTFSGVAPEAQLAIFKVFSDSSNGATTVDILAALSDAVLLGVDALNLSLGSSGGFGQEEAGSLLEEIYDLVAESGIILNISAGNSYNAYQGSSAGDLPLTSNPDSGIISSPSAYDMALSVASINASATSSFMAGEEAIPYNDISGHKLVDELKAGTYEYVMVPGYGSPEDYANIDVKGKIAVVQRGGGITFNDKQVNAANNGAIACFIYNNRDGYLLNMAIDNYMIPTAALSLGGGQALGKLEDKKVTINDEVQGYTTMSDFSSWGPLPSLELKPEITAPGGDIYSAVPGGRYEYMSGTSMASPYMAGASAIMKQYLSQRFPTLSYQDIETLSNRLYMSTAVPYLDKDGVTYSPRKQGAGVVDIDAALNSKAYLYVKGEDKPKVELGDDKAEVGVYDISFHVVNMTSKAISYDISTLVQTETASKDGKTTMEKGYPLKNADTSNITVAGKGSLNGNTLTVSGNGDAEVTVKVVLGEEDKKYMRDTFENGIYVEGFVNLDALNEEDSDLSIPYLGFFGDWTEAPLMDVDAFSDESPLMYATDILGVYGLMYVFPAGAYAFNLPEGAKVPERSMDKIAMGLGMGNGLSNLYPLAGGLLRGAKSAHITIADKDTDEIYFEKTVINTRRARYNNDSILPGYVGDTWPTLLNYSGLDSNTRLTYNVDLNLDYDEPQNTKGETSYSFDLNVDGEAPYVVNRDSLQFYEGSDGNMYLDVVLEDSNYLMAATLYSAAKEFSYTNPNGAIVPGKNYYEYMTPIYDSTPDKESKITFDVTDFYDNLFEGTFYILAYDYAMNEGVYKVVIPKVAPETVELSAEELTIKTNEVAKLTAAVLPENSTNKGLIWSSSDESVVMVRDGEITGLKAGAATITAASTDSSSINDTITVTVLEEAVSPIEATDFEVYSSSLDVFVDASAANRIMNWNPYNATNRVVTWSSSNEAIATAAAGTTLSSGSQVPAAIVTGVSPGVATITGTTNGGGKASFTVTVKKSTGSFVINGTTLVSYTGQEAIVNVPEGVTAIADNAFNNNDYIKVVNLPESVETIGYRAFYDCDALVSVDLPETMTSIGEGAFQNSEVLKDITLPNGLTEIATRTFYNCKSLNNVTIPETVTTIGAEAFYNCQSFTEIIMPDSITTLDPVGGQWQMNTNVTKVVISSKLTALPQKTFMGLYSITELPDLKNVTVLGDSAFHSAYSLKHLVIPETVESIGNLAFAYSRRLVDRVVVSGMETVEFKGSPATIGKGVFTYNELLTTVTGKLTTIGEGMFERNTSLVNFEVPDEVTKIGKNAFKNSANLETIVFSANSKFEAELGAMESQPFVSATKFKGIVVEEGNANLTVDENGFVYNKDKTYLLYVPPTFTGTEVVLPESLEVIGDEAFYAVAKNLTSVTIPDSVTYIGDYAFYGAVNLVELKIPNSTTYIGEAAFYNASSLTTLVMGNSVEIIGNNAFYGCVKLKAVEFPATLKSIGNGAFQNCTSLTSLTFQEGLISIGKDAFRNCNSVTSIILPQSLETLGDYAFAGCKVAIEINTGGLTVIPAYAFSEALKAEKITVSDKVTAIGNYAFNRSSSLKEFVWPSSLETIGNNAFYFPHQLTSLDLSGTKVKSIGNSAFYQSYSINNLVLPETLETIGTQAFAYMNYYGTSSSYGNVEPIKEVVIPSKVNTIPTNAFNYTRYLEKITVDESNAVYTSTVEGLLIVRDTGAIHIWPLGNTTTEFTIPDSMTSIPSSMFANNKSLKKIIIPGHVTSVGSSAFSGSNIETVVFERSNNGIVIGSMAFSNCINLTSVTLPRGLTSIGSNAFSSSTALESIVIPGTVVTIGDNAFRGNTALKNVTLQEGIVEIMGGAFSGCTALAEITIPKSVSYIATEVATNPFAGSSALQNIYVTDGSYNYVDIDGVLYDYNEKTLRIYPMGRTAEEYVIPEGTTRVGYKSFYNNKYLKKVHFPSTLQRVGDQAFYGCENLNDYIFNGTYAPLLELSTYLSGHTTQIGYYGTFKNFYFDINSGNNKDLALNLYYPEGGQGYDSRVWKAFFYTANGSVTEMTVDNMLGLESLTAVQVDNTHNVQVDWSTPQWATSYKVERSVAKEVNTDDQLTYLFDGFEDLGNVTENGYLDENLVIGLTYAYRVTAVKGEDEAAVYGPEKYVFVTINGLNSDEEAASTVVKAIEALKPVDGLTSEDKSRVAEVRAMYDALTDAQKVLVSNQAVLVQAENQVAANGVVNLIAALPNPITLEDEEAIKAVRAAYDALTEEQKALVENYNLLLEAEKTFAELRAKAEEEAASAARVEAVKNAIEAIGEVTLEDEEAIKATRNAYDALSEDEKAKIDNYNKLTTAEETLAKLKAEAEEEASSAARVEAVEKAIAAIGEVTLEDEEAIMAARAAYNALSTKEKAKVENYDKLKDSEKALKKLKKGKDKKKKDNKEENKDKKNKDNKDKNKDNKNNKDKNNDNGKGKGGKRTNTSIRHMLN